jgi:hypothetical protein
LRNVLEKDRAEFRRVPLEQRQGQLQETFFTDIESELEKKPE